MLEKKNIERIYESFSEDIEPTEEMVELYDEFAEKMIELKDILNEEQIEKLEEVEDIFTKITTLETKHAFIKGFSVSTNLILEAKE